MKNRRGEIAAEFEYDGDGGRTKKVYYPSPESPVTSIYIGSLFENADGQEKRYVYLGSKRVAALNGTDTSFYLEDHLGGVNLIVDEEESVNEVIEYQPYGAFARHDFYGGAQETSDFYFTGQRLDESTGLYYYNARYYDPGLGRFITPDSLVPGPDNPQSLNRYSYCGNNPVNRIDPSGHGWWKKFCGFFASIIGVFLGALNPFLGMLAYSLVSASGQGGNFGMNFGANFASSLVGWGIGTGVGKMWGDGFLSGLTASALGGAGAGATTSAILGGDVGLGALGGLAGGTVGFLGSKISPMGASALAGGTSAEIQGGEFGEGALQGSLNSAGETVGGILAPGEKFNANNAKEGDIVYLKPDSLQGLLISLFEGGPFSHVGIVARDSSGNLTLASTNFKGDNGYTPLSKYEKRGAFVSTRFRGNKSVINAAKALATQPPRISYGFFPGQKVCSTITAAALNNAGYRGWYGIGPNTQAMGFGYHQFHMTRSYGY